MIRNRFQGHHLATRGHSKADFYDWQKDFYVILEEHSKNCYMVGLRTGSGEDIIKYPDQGCSNDLGEDLKFLFGSTGWGSSGDWNMITEKGLN